MLKSDDWLYLDLQKTGCTFLRKKLPHISDSENVKGKKHIVPSASDYTLPKILTIRDPSTYYFSLWSYGLDKRGGLWKKAKKNLNSKELKNIYGDKSQKCFSKFLRLVLQPKDYLVPFKGIDLYTYRILRLLIPSREEILEFNSSLNSECSEEALNKKLNQYLPEVLIPTEYLNSCFHTFADNGQLDFLRLNPKWKDFFPLDAELKNSSKLSRSINSEKDSHPFLTEKIISRIEKNSLVALWLHKKAVSNFNLMNAAKT